MTRNATRSCRPAERGSRGPVAAIICGAALIAVAAPASAQKIVTDEDTSVGDVMLSPLNDLNLANDPIPPVLVRAYAAPYDDVGLADCNHLEQEIGNLDAVLGEDFDTPRSAHEGGSPEGIAKGVLTGFIPFRGVIRHLSGAKLHEWEFRQSITAGLMRRAYLKGLGQGLGCAYPARPVPPGLLVRPEGAGVISEEQRGAD